jgi:hypothetical protein
MESGDKGKIKKRHTESQILSAPGSENMIEPLPTDIIIDQIENRLKKKYLSGMEKSLSSRKKLFYPH